jgi:adenine/guanine phosphoribosyltransferase-like PRPP-binding protein
VWLKPHFFLLNLPVEIVSTETRQRFRQKAYLTPKAMKVLVTAEADGIFMAFFYARFLNCPAWIANARMTWMDRYHGEEMDDTCE